MKKTYQFILNLTVLFVVVLFASFYGWVITQFNETKFQEKLTHYFSRSFPGYSLKVVDLDFILTNKLRYRLKDVDVYEKPDFSEFAHFDELIIEFPVTSFFGGREIRFKATGATFIFKSNKELKNLFFKRENKKVDVDFPSLLVKNDVSLDVNKMLITTRDHEQNIPIDRFFLKNTNLKGYTAFELLAPLENYGGIKGGVELFGEIDIHQFIKEKKIDIDGYLHPINFKDPFLNDLRFKIRTNKNGDHHSFDVTSTSNDLVGGLNLEFSQSKFTGSNINLKMKEKRLSKFLGFNDKFKCEDNDASVLAGTMEFSYEYDHWLPRLQFQGKCIAGLMKASDELAKSYLWDFSLLEQSANVLLLTRDFHLDAEDILKLEIKKDIYDMGYGTSIHQLLSIFENQWFISSGTDFHFPFKIDVKQFMWDDRKLSFEANGIIKDDEMVVENYHINEGEKEVSAGSFVANKGTGGFSYEGKMKFEQFPSNLLRNLLNLEGFDFKGDIKKGNLVLTEKLGQKEYDFNFEFSHGEFQWENFIQVINKEVLPDNLRESLKWSKDFKSLRMVGGMANGAVEIDYYLVPKDSRLARSGQIKKTADSTNINLELFYHALNPELKENISKEFGKNYISLKFQQDNVLRLIK